MAGYRITYEPAPVSYHYRLTTADKNRSVVKDYFMAHPDKSNNQIALELGLSISQVGRILLRRGPFGNRKLNPDKVREIRNLIAKGKSYREIADMFGVGPSCIKKIRSRKTWRHVI